MRSMSARRLLTLATTLTMAVAVLAACGAAPAGPAAAPVETAARVELDTSYEDALDEAGQLALGTLKLEGTDHAVTPEQAEGQLPLWQALRSGSLQSEEETEAVLKQIKAKITDQQFNEIAGMRLTSEDIGTWAEDHGFAYRQGERPGQDYGEHGFGQEGSLEDLPAEMQEMLREQFGGELPSPEQLEELGGQYMNLSPEEREARRATAEAGGQGFGGPDFGPGRGASFMLLNPVINLLTERAEE